MNTNKISKAISLVLRHNPGFIGATLDKNGWLYVKDLIEGLNAKGYVLDESSLTEIVKTNNKQRFAFNENKEKIRANQGHSVNVDVELHSKEPPKFLFHGTVQKFIKSIKQEGLKKMNRQHVHLSKDEETAIIVAKRRGEPIILSINAAQMHERGRLFYVSENGVWLTDYVEPEFINFAYEKKGN